MLAFKASSFLKADHAGQRQADQPSLTASNIRVAPRTISGGNNEPADAALRS
jgi:hypothetical protein